MLELRTKLDADDMDRFDQKIDPMRIKITSIIRSLTQLCTTQVQSEEDRNIYDELYQAQTFASGDQEAPIVSWFFLLFEKTIKLCEML